MRICRKVLYLDNQQIILQNYNYYDENSHKN